MALGASVGLPLFFFWLAPFGDTSLFFVPLSPVGPATDWRAGPLNRATASDKLTAVHQEIRLAH
jgi:hypothetical protein